MNDGKHAGYAQKYNCLTLMNKDVCFIIPHRNRQQHLQLLLQELPSDSICVVHQTDTLKFNRGALLNLGFLHTDAQAVVFHDCDLVPDAAMLQHYMQPWPTPVVHFGCRFSRYNNTKAYFGGVTGFQRDAFPGFSNRYWGWGGEDDSLLKRCKGMRIHRPETGSYTDLEFLPTARSKLDRLGPHNKCMDKWEVRDSEVFNDSDNHNTLAQVHVDKKVVDGVLHIRADLSRLSKCQTAARG